MTDLSHKYVFSSGRSASIARSSAGGSSTGGSGSSMLVGGGQLAIHVEGTTPTTCATRTPATIIDPAVAA